MALQGDEYIIDAKTPESFNSRTKMFCGESDPFWYLAIFRWMSVLDSTDCSVLLRIRPGVLSWFRYMDLAQQEALAPYACRTHLRKWLSLMKGVCKESCCTFTRQLQCHCNHISMAISRMTRFWSIWGTILCLRLRRWQVTPVTVSAGRFWCASLRICGTIAVQFVIWWPRLLWVIQVLNQVRRK